MSNVHATIVVPVFNGELELPELLDGIERQQAPFNFEVLVIDSGSRDASVALVRERMARDGRYRLHEIPNVEFGHGRTRNLGAQLAAGEFVVFVTQDAVPAHDAWLVELLRPFDQIGEPLVAVFGKQIPRQDCVPIVKRDVSSFFASFGPDHFVSVQAGGSPLLDGQAVRDALGFMSDVNSAMRRRLLVDEIPFEDVDYAEDQVLGRAVIAGGKLKAYVPLGAVVHSHSYGPRTYLRRMYDEFSGLAAATGNALPITRRQLWFGWIRPTLGDVRFVLRDRDYGPRAKVKWIMLAPVYNILRRVAIRAAMRPDPSARMRRLLSLEHRVRRSS